MPVPSKPFLAPLGAVAALSAACAAPPAQAPQPVAVRSQAVVPTAPVLPRVAKTVAPGVELLWTADWFGGVSLLGVDAQGQRALVRLEAQTPAPRLVLEVVDVANGSSLSQWEAAPDHAKRATQLGVFSAITGDFRADALRFGALLSEVGPWHLRGSIASPTFAVAPERRAIVYGAPPTDGSDGDWLFATPADGSSARRVDAGLRASYSPVVSPDGRFVAFRGCASSPCDYGLYLSELDGGTPKRAPGVQQAAPPVWSVLGDAVFAVGQKSGRPGERCLLKVAPQGVVPRALHCVKGLEEVEFEQDPEGRTGVLMGVRGEPGKQVVELHWLLLADGTVLSSHSVPRATGGGVLSQTGLLAMPMQRGGIGLVDLVTGANTLVDDPHGWFFGFDGARWVGDRVVLLRKLDDQPGYQIVSVDARQLTAKSGGWASLSARSAD